MMKQLMLAACLAALPLAGAAAEGPLSGTYSACMEKSGGVTVAMQDCIADELALQDKRLNAAYKALMDKIPAKRKTQLRDAQRKWIAFRDGNCAFYADPDGGSADRLAANECVVTATAQRAAELENLKPE